MKYHNIVDVRREWSLRATLTERLVSRMANGVTPFLRYDDDHEDDDDDDNVDDDDDDDYDDWPMANMDKTNDFDKQSKISVSGALHHSRDWIRRGECL